MTLEKINRFISLTRFLLQQSTIRQDLKQKKPMLTLAFHFENMHLIYVPPTLPNQWLMPFEWLVMSILKLTD